MMNVKLILISVLFFAGCSSEFNLATKREETLIYGTDKEVAMGDTMAQQIEKKLAQL